MKVSVGLIAYNHEPYIEQAVQGVLAQKTNFDYEIVIGEDCSTDNTRSILVRVQEQHPDKIRLLLNEKNQGMIQNYIQTLHACQGEYIALLDGDDYWCREDKLQKQVDFLDQNPDYAVCFHSVLKVYEDGSREPKVVRPKDQRTSFDLKDLLASMFIPTCSTLIRNGLIGELPEFAYSLKMLDWLILVLAARHGRIGFLDEVMAVYRVHPSGLWSSMSMVDRLTANIQFLEAINSYLEYQYDEAVQSVLRKYWSFLSNEVYNLAVAQETWVDVDMIFEEFFNVSPVLTSMKPGWKNELLERIYCYYLITAYESGKHMMAWNAWLRLVKNDPTMLLNRGLMMMAFRSAAKILRGQTV
jgi:glycosyltransferase involved in cell wall biosynthesis